MPIDDPLQNFRYRLEMDKVVRARFSEVSVGDASEDPFEYREGSEITTVRRLTRLNKYGNVILQWGVAEWPGLADWHGRVADDPAPPAAERRTLVIRTLDKAGEVRVAHQIVGAWPIGYRPADVNDKGDEVPIESLVLANDGIRRIP